VSDNFDTGLSATMTGSVDANTPGTYTLVFNATDSAGNTATPVERTVTVTGTSTGNGGGTNNGTSNGSSGGGGGALTLGNLLLMFALFLLFNGRYRRNAA
jgi:hypothetical protein